MMSSTSARDSPDTSHAAEYLIHQRSLRSLYSLSLDLLRSVELPTCAVKVPAMAAAYSLLRISQRRRAEIVVRSDRGTLNHSPWGADPKNCQSRKRSH